MEDQGCESPGPEDRAAAIEPEPQASAGRLQVSTCDTRTSKNSLGYVPGQGDGDTVESWSLKVRAAVSSPVQFGALASR